MCGDETQDGSMEAWLARMEADSPTPANPRPMGPLTWVLNDHGKPTFPGDHLDPSAQRGVARLTGDLRDWWDAETARVEAKRNKS